MAELREAISQRVIAPLDLVMLTRERIEDAVNDAVSRGRVTADDAQDLVSGLLDRGRKQTNDVLSDLEQLMGRGKGEIEGRTGAARKRGTDAARKAASSRQSEGDLSAKNVAELREAISQRVIAPLDLVMLTRERIEDAVNDAVSRGRVTADDAQDLVSGLLDRGRKQTNDVLSDLSPAELRKVRDYERRHANRKTVLSAI
ncbi:MAG: hypothetical protein H0U20_09685, partial [Thermoleophilaceae bacterium]|nr:hypothetical protein [Thermoleophilaceae bacterium]